VLSETLAERLPSIHASDIRLRLCGDPSTLDGALAAALSAATQLTAGNGGMTLTLCVGYSGRAHILAAARALVAAAQSGGLSAGDVDEAMFDRAMHEAAWPGLTSDAGRLRGEAERAPNPDLLIRTSEQRLSDFGLWEAAWSEIFFSPLLWPDFDRAALGGALQEYGERRRRFGASSGT
jgi:undecaprenyl diphosphate synthase